MTMHPVLKTFLSALICIVATGLVFAAESHAPLDEIREILRSRLYPPPEEVELQALTPENLGQKLEKLDPHARYFPVEQAAEQNAQKASWTGIGAQLFEGNGHVLLSPFSRGPMAQAGVSERAELLEINGHSVQGRDLHEVAAMFHGEPERLVQLRLRPWSADSAKTVEIFRSSFRPLDVELIQTAHQPVLRIRDFVAGQTRSALKASIDFLDLQESPLIIDLRESGGGDLYEALDCAGLFVPQGKSLGGLMTRESGKSMVISPPVDKVSMPVVLLVGPDTASAAEVFAAALQHHGRSVLIGRPTYGKCTTQTEVTLSDGLVLRFTNGRLLAPEGRECSTGGLEPDWVVSKSRLYDLEYIVAQARNVQLGGF